MTERGERSSEREMLLERRVVFQSANQLAWTQVVSEWVPLPGCDSRLLTHLLQQLDKTTLSLRGHGELKGRATNRTTLRRKQGIGGQGFTVLRETGLNRLRGHESGPPPRNNFQQPPCSACRLTSIGYVGQPTEQSSWLRVPIPKAVKQQVTKSQKLDFACLR